MAATFTSPRFFHSCSRKLLLHFQHQRRFLLCHLPAPPLPTAAAAPHLLSTTPTPGIASPANTATCLGCFMPPFPHGCGKRAFTTSSSSRSSTPRFTNTNASFDWSDDDDDGGGGRSDAKKEQSLSQKMPLDKSKLPPPYDPFSKKPVVEESKDPKDLQEIFHKMRTEGLTNYAIKMFDGLSKDGLTHEALALFAQIKDKGSMPDVVAHTAVIEAYANAGGHSKEALKTYERMLASGVNPNAYTYSVLIKGLARDGKLKDAGKYILDMMTKGMKPNVATYTAVFEAYVKEGNEDQAKMLLEEMRGKGFTPDEKAVREHLGKRGHVFRSLMSLLFGK
ncbi:hypothetical protein Taro_054483 [Colocasia esculenta]|uniref:Pentatricopeptide repeat-containing protein n=1 Tax=Colocasia esculenta TaxID=4460 RepID=A0A843XQK2_COLES|nr:hypothetical protein [Colocasia esculenta]